MDQPSSNEARYYCAGRYCTVREVCHRHTSSTQINRAEFDDYDLAMIRDLPKPCIHYIDRDQVTTDVNS